MDALHQSRAWGFLGDGPLDTHISHAQGFADAAESLQLEETPETASPVGIGDGRWMDLGSGGGIPGLILAHRWPHREVVLLDSNERRAGFLLEVVQDQGWGSRVIVVTDRAEVAGRTEGLRGAFSLVVARSFGSPPVTAECAAPFLQVGGSLIVSEPPRDEASAEAPATRWPDEGLAAVGLQCRAQWRTSYGYQILRQVSVCPDRFPRRVGIPAKRPLYRLPEA
jgi:16S rRNA (guanine527-N7)-methyltransferase